MAADYLPVLVEAVTGLSRIIGLQAVLAGIVFIPVLVLSRVLRKSSPLLLQALWGLVLLRLVLPPDLGSPIGLEGLAGSSALQPAAEAVGVDLSPLLPNEPWAMPADPARAADAGGGVAWWPTVLGLAWLVGTLVVGLLLVRRRREYQKLVHDAASVTDAGILALQRRWCRELRIRRRVSLVTSDESCVPFTLGSLRPVIFLPRALLEQGDADVLESVLAHELAHVKRWDDALLVIQLAIATPYFFHPLAWLSLNRMQEAGEHGCDELVLSRGRLGPGAYGRSILAVIRLGLGSRPALAPALRPKTRRVQMRLKAIMTKRSAAAFRARRMTALPAAFCLALLVLPLASQPVVRDQATVAASGVGQDSLVWVNPMPGARITSRFGPAVNPFTGKEAHHRGIDLVGEPGAEILAAASGVVEEATAEFSGGRDHGTVVILDHGNGIRSFYSHLADLGVGAGDRVQAGAVLGTQGSSGKVTGPHLHLEIWVAGERRDPALYITELAG